jgi:hypothetical protein
MQRPRQLMLPTSMLFHSHPRHPQARMMLLHVKVQSVGFIHAVSCLRLSV